MALLNLHYFMHLSKLIIPAAAVANNVSYVTNDRDAVLMAKHITTYVSQSLLFDSKDKQWDSAKSHVSQDAGMDLGFYSPSERGTKGGVLKGVGSGEGAVPPLKKIFIFLVSKW